MRVALIAGEYPPLEGGLGDFTRELARAVAAAGHAVCVLTRPARSAAAEESSGGVAVRRLSQGWGWGTPGQVRAFIGEWRPDVLNLQYQAAAYGMHPAVNLLPWRVGRLAPLVVTFHDLRAPYLFPKAGPLRRQAMQFMARTAQAVIVTNVEDRERLFQAGLRHVHLVPIGSNITPAPVQDFDRRAWLRQRGLPSGAEVIGYFGFLNESKGGETLVRALAALVTRGRAVNLLLIGGQTGDSDPTNRAYAARLMQLAEELGVRDRITATGFLDGPDVSRAFAACACVALPYRDGVSFRRGTFMAAIAHGCAVVTTVPRVRLAELRHGENVWLVPPDDPAGLADALARVLEDGALRAALQAGGRQLSRLFAWDHIAAETLRVYRSVLPGAPASPSAAAV